MKLKTQGLSVVAAAAAVLIAVLGVTGCGGERGGDGASASGPEEEARVVEEGYQSASVGDIFFQWKTEGTTLLGILQAPTQGWVAVGFDPGRGMEDANIIIGYVKDATASVRDDFGTWFSSHDDDEKLGGTRDVTVLGGSEGDGITTLRFSIPLDSGDSNDKRLIAGNEYTILLAYGARDDFTGMHRKKGKVQITL